MGWLKSSRSGKNRSRVIISLVSYQFIWQQPQMAAASDFNTYQSRMLVKQTVFFCIYPVKLAVAPNKEV